MLFLLGYFHAVYGQNNTNTSSALKNKSPTRVNEASNIHTKHFHDFIEHIQVTELNKSADSGWKFFQI